jgi:superfamily I DNA/RNA helicase
MVLIKKSCLTLPANEEQLRIVKCLQSNGAVLVQGPPGTGKTHTIANLIGHLLSEGKSVLVTSQTEKALNVLKEKVFKDQYYDLRSMCINLSKDKSQRTEMDIAISALAEQQSNFDEHYYHEVIEGLQDQRIKLLDGLAELKRNYLKIKNKEYVDLIYDGITIKPIDAANLHFCRHLYL